MMTSPSPQTKHIRQQSEPANNPMNPMNMTRRNVGDLSPPKQSHQKAPPPGFQIAPATKATTGIKSQLAALSSNQPSKLRGAIN